MYVYSFFYICAYVCVQKFVVYVSCMGLRYTDWLQGGGSFVYMCMFLRDFCSFDIMLLHLKLQTCFVLPGVIRTI